MNKSITLEQRSPRRLRDLVVFAMPVRVSRSRNRDAPRRTGPKSVRGAARPPADRIRSASSDDGCGRPLEAGASLGFDQRHFRSGVRPTNRFVVDQGRWGARRPAAVQIRVGLSRRGFPRIHAALEPAIQGRNFDQGNSWDHDSESACWYSRMSRVRVSTPITCPPPSVPLTTARLAAS